MPRNMQVLRTPEITATVPGDVPMPLRITGAK